MHRVQKNYQSFKNCVRVREGTREGMRKRERVCAHVCVCGGVCAFGWVIIELSLGKY